MKKELLHRLELALQFDHSFVDHCVYKKLGDINWISGCSVNLFQGSDS